MMITPHRTPRRSTSGRTTPLSTTRRLSSWRTPCRLKARSFKFDSVFGGSGTSLNYDCLYESEVASLVGSVCNGISSTCMAYGSTGSGKTFGMFGGANQAEDGLVMKAGSDILSAMGEEDQLRFTFVELYNDNFHDLLLSANEGSLSKITMKKDRRRSVYLHGSPSLRTEIQSREQLESLVKKGIKTRQSTSTNCNDRSSRSHCIVTFELLRNGRVSAHAVKAMWFDGIRGVLRRGV